MSLARFIMNRPASSIEHHIQVGNICAVHGLTYAPLTELNGRRVEICQWETERSGSLCRLMDHHTSNYFLLFKPGNLRRIDEPVSRVRQASSPRSRSRSRSNARAARMGAAENNSTTTSVALPRASSSAADTLRSPGDSAQEILREDDDHAQTS